MKGCLLDVSVMRRYSLLLNVKKLAARTCKGHCLYLYGAWAGWLVWLCAVCTYIS